MALRAVKELILDYQVLKTVEPDQLASDEAS